MGDLNKGNYLEAEESKVILKQIQARIKLAIKGIEAMAIALETHFFFNN